MALIFKRIDPNSLSEQSDWRPRQILVYGGIPIGFSAGIDLNQKSVRCLEGWRVSTRKGATGYDDRIERAPIFRQANIEPLRFRLSLKHYQKPAFEGEWSVRPGDVVLNKIEPVQAAVVSMNMRRHPIDGNCVIIRGLAPPEAFWVAFCLSQEKYSARLLRGDSPPRLSISGLREMQVPMPPPGSERLAASLLAWNDEAFSNGESLARLVGDVERSVTDLGSPVHKVDDPPADPLRPGCRLPAADIEDSWLPMHVEVRHRLNGLMRDADWLPVSSLAVSWLQTEKEETNKYLEDIGRIGVYIMREPDPSSIAKSGRPRLRETPARGRYLRLSHAEEDLTYRIPEAEDLIRWSFRLYREPLSSGEVLVSKLASNPRVVYVDVRPVETTYVADHWERIRFRETPGAWALLFNTSGVQELIRRFASDLLHQFARSESIRSIVLPPVAFEERREWDEKLRAHHQRKRELEERWDRLWAEAESLYARAHGEKPGGTAG